MKVKVVTNILKANANLLRINIHTYPTDGDDIVWLVRHWHR